MARLRRRKDRDDTYLLDYVDPSDGRRYQINVGPSREIAEIWLAKCQERIALVKLGHLERVGKLTQADIEGKRKQAEEQREKQVRISEYRKFHESLARNELGHKKDTISVYNSAFSSLQSVIGDTYLDAVDVSEVRRWRDVLRKEGKSKTAESMWGRSLKAAWNRAIKEGYAKQNPFREVKFPGQSETRRKDKNMKPEEVEKLLEVIDASGEKQFANYVRCLLYTGLRRAEILSLRGENVDLQRRILEVTITKKRGEPLKMKVPITNALYQVLAGMDIKPGEYLFKTTARKNEYRQRGTPWEKAHVTHKFKEFLRLAGLANAERYSLHSLRRTYITYLHEKGIPTNIIQQLVGHSSPLMTMEYDSSTALSYRQFAEQMDIGSLGGKPEEG